MSAPLAVELLEERLVMTVSPMSLATAQTNALMAQSALLAAQSNFLYVMTGLENTLTGDYATHANTANQAMDSATAAFDAAIDGINSGLAGIVAGLTSGFEAQVDLRETTLESSVDGINNSFNSTVDGLTTSLLNSLAGAQSFFDGAVDGANGVLDNAINGPGGFRAVMDGIIGPAQTLFQANLNGINTAFAGFMDGQRTIYDGQELGFWNTYLTATDSSPTGLQGVYSAAVASDAAIRDGVLSLYPNVIYDPSILAGTTAYDSLMSGANSTLDGSLTTAMNTFNANVQGHENTFDTAINGPGGAQAVYDGLMVPVNAGFDAAITAADTIYNGAITAAQGVYDTAVNGPTGLVANFLSQVATYQSTYDGKVQTAQGIRDGLITAAETAYTGAVTLAQQTYDNWLNDPANPFALAMQNRVTALDQQLTMLSNLLDGTLAGLQNTMQSGISAANTTYNNLAGDPITGFTTLFNNAVLTARATADSNTELDWSNYSSLYSTFTSTDMLSMLGSMMGGLPTSVVSTGTMLTDTQNYALDVAAEEITYTDSVGSAYLTYVSAERAADTTRDQSIVAAINEYLLYAIAAVDGFQTQALTAIKSGMTDLTNLEAAFETADVVQQVAKSNSINNAAQTHDLSVTIADEGFSISESNAAKTLAQDIANDVEPLRNGEMGARISLGQTAASAAEAWEISHALGIQTWINGAASAANQYTILATNAAETLQNSLLGEGTLLTSAATTALQTWIGTVASGTAGLWSTSMGGGIDVTTVANAWSAFSQSAVNDWSNFANGEAGLFQTYGQQEASAHKTGDQNISAQNVVREGQIGTEIVSVDSILAGAIKGFEQSGWSAMSPWMSAVATAEHTANNLASGAINTFELLLAPQVHSAADGITNALHGYFGGVLSDFTPYAQNVITQNQIAGHKNVTEVDLLLNTARATYTQHSQENRASWNLYSNSAAGAEDGVVNATAGHLKAQAVLDEVTEYNNTAALSPSSFESQVGVKLTMMPLGAMTTLTGSVNDDTLATLVGNLANSSSSDPQEFIRQLHASVNPIQNTTYLTLAKPVHENNLEGHLRRSGLGNFLPPPGHESTAFLVLSDALRNQITSDLQDRPQPPGEWEGMVPFRGPFQNMLYSWQTNDPFAATFYAAMMASDVFLVKSLAQGTGQLVVRGGQRIVRTLSAGALEGIGANAAAGAGQAGVGAVAKVGGALGVATTYAQKSLPTPQVFDPKLKNLVDALFKGAKGPNPIGTGSTADALRNELLTGLPTHGRFHMQKAQENVTALTTWLRKNLNAAHQDRLVAQSLLDDLISALAGN